MDNSNVKKRKTMSFDEFLKNKVGIEKGDHKVVDDHYSGEKKGDAGVNTLEEPKKIKIVKESVIDEKFGDMAEFTIGSERDGSNVNVQLMIHDKVIASKSDTIKNSIGGNGLYGKIFDYAVKTLGGRTDESYVEADVVKLLKSTKTNESLSSMEWTKSFKVGDTVKMTGNFSDKEVVGKIKKLTNDDIWLEDDKHFGSFSWSAEKIEQEK